MALYKVKPFGKGGIYITLNKKDGFKVGDEVEIANPSQKNLLDPTIITLIKKSLEPWILGIVEKAIDDAKRGY